ncbi:MAG: protein kinase [Myxococcales bacterium]|nr:protein kinase [Myxococcales bacterium]
MGGDEELAIRILVAEGVMCADEARELRQDPLWQGRSLLEQLRAMNRISDMTLASVRAKLGKLSPALPDLTPLVLARPRIRPEAPAVELPPVVADADAAPMTDEFPVPSWDRYDPIRLLGQGGMGKVFLARDLRLEREVAIKFVLGEDPEQARRVLAEARAQARVNHDRVCKVYEVGEVRGRVYIAMQYIAGRSLSELGDELTLEQKVIVVREAALGVAEAHRVGLIHRDLKPSNIMVERTADGELRPYVMDFGVARDWADGATLTGSVVGTPAYMAPEQARGERALDRRADVYSLGATLYALLTKQPPMAGSNPLVVLMRVCNDEPVRPRVIDPDIPRDLDAIAIKCLEKERGARYDSARALADDLSRFLAGEPVEARAMAGAGYRMRKWLRRRRRVVASIAIAAALVVTAVGFAVYERQQASRRAGLARRFTERVERIESMARYAMLGPAHDVRPDRARLRSAIDALAREVREGGMLAAGPGHYALGRGHLALGEDAHAAAELTSAWNSGYHEPHAAYTLALAEGRLYQQALREIEQLPSSQRDEQRQVAQHRYRDPALVHLRDSHGADSPSADYVAALVAYYEKRYDDALRHLDVTDGQGLTWFYEAQLLRGEVLSTRATTQVPAASPERMVADFAEARGALAEAASVGRSDPAVYIAQGELEQRALRLEIYGAGKVTIPFDAGIAAADRALAIDPDNVAALALRVGLRTDLAEYRGNRGEDVTSLLASAVADARRAVELSPSQLAAKLVLARAYRQWGEFRQGRSEDPSVQLGAALEITSSIAASDRTYATHVLVGLIHKVWADYQDQTSQDAASHRTQAIDAYMQALQLNDLGKGAWLNLGINYYERASQRHDDEAEADLSRGLEALERGLALQPGSSLPYFYEGEIYALLAERKKARGADPAPERARAIDKYRKGLEISPDLPHLHNGICIVQGHAARDAIEHGQDPTVLLNDAQSAAMRAIEAAPDQGYGYNNLGDVLLRRAKFERAKGRDPRPTAREAIRAFTQALDRVPVNLTFLLNLGEIHSLVAAYEIDQARAPGESLAGARRSIDRALAQNPTLPEGLRLRTELGAIEARWKVR